MKAFARILKDVGIAIYCVGGCVRDWLLERAVCDIDLCSRLRPTEIIEICKKNGICCTLKCERTGTVLVKLGEIEYEHTTFRTESYGTGGCHQPEEIRFTESLQQDAFRRDFSINALYMDVLSQQIIDPTGGLEDINRRILRTTTKDPEEILKDDGLRILRLVRLCYWLGFEIDEDTMQCAKEQAGLLRDIAFERKRDELNKILLLDRVYDALCCMDELGLWRYIIEEMDECRGMEQRKDHHKHDVLHHLFHAVENIPAQLELRYMALLHDVGKPPCKRDTGNQYLHDEYSERMAGEILKRLMLPNAVVERVCFAVRNHMFDIAGFAKDSTIRQRFCRWGVSRTEDVILLREADVRGSGYKLNYVAERWRKLLHDMQFEGAPFSIRDLNITGEDIMRELSLTPCKMVGQIQQKLLLHCASHPSDNTKQRLLKLAHDYVNAP